MRVLAEKEASPPWELGAGDTFDFLRCETEQPIDDLMIGTSSGGVILIQAKHKVRLEKAPGAPLGAALAQFANQFMGSRTASGPHPWDRPVDPSRDRFVLVTGRGSSVPICDHLPQALAKYRSQPFSEDSLTQEEQRAISMVISHLERLWVARQGAPLSEEDLQSLLRLIWVEVLDVEGGPAEREARDLLRRSVVVKPEEADVAWDRLVQFCTEAAGLRAGADRDRLQGALVERGLGLQVVRSYRTDIDELLAYSRLTLNLLSERAKIMVGHTEVKIYRRSTRALRAMAEEGPVVVIGEPGGGKSGVLHDLVAQMEADGQDVVFLAVDRVGAQSLPLLRNELGLSHDVIEVLRAWHGQRPAFLVVDALDAARSEGSAQMLQDLLSQVGRLAGRWRVVASIRTFDLRHNRWLRQVFTGRPSEQFQNPEFDSFRHVSVPRLSADELDQIEPRSPALAAVVERAPSSLRSLIEVPFNLRLVGELIGEGIPLQELAPIQTQIQLLGRYWEERVIQTDGRNLVREAVLRKLTRAMVSKRALRVDQEELDIHRSDHSEALHALLRHHVLLKWQPLPSSPPDDRVITFSHHVLFDYSAARLLLRDLEETLTWFSGEPDLLLAVRPSLVFRYQMAWDGDPTRQSFWDAVLRAIESSIPDVGKLVGLGVAVELASSAADFKPLLDRYDARNKGQQEAVYYAFRHLVGTLLAAPYQDRVLDAERLDAWCEVAERTTRRLDHLTAYAIVPLLHTLTSRCGRMTPRQTDVLGRVARRVLELVWSPDQWEGHLAIQGIKLVCHTFTSDPIASAELLRVGLEREHVRQHGAEELMWLAWEIGPLMKLDPVLVEDIYEAVFTYQEKSREPTPMGGRVLSMVSNRQQDYDSAPYHLTEVFPEFIKAAPLHATRAMLVALEFYLTEDRPKQLARVEEPIDFSGVRASISSDLSYMWGAFEHIGERYPVKLLAEFRRHLERLAESNETEEDRGQLISLVVGHNRPAAVWRQLLQVGAKYPGTLGLQIRPLAWALPILTNMDTEVAAREYVAAVFGFLDRDERNLCERAILSIPRHAPFERQDHANRDRDRLLSRLPVGQLVTEEAKALRSAIPDAVPAASEEEQYVTSGFTGQPIDTEEQLRWEGVDTKALPNRRLLDLLAQVRTFPDESKGKAVTLETVQATLPKIRELHSALQSETGADPKLTNDAWGYLAQACRWISGADWLPSQREVGALVKAVLLVASCHPVPMHDPESDQQFDESPSWLSPAARIDAAAGLVLLARYQEYADSEVLQAVQRLAGDDVPAVRLQVARWLTLLYHTTPETMWGCIESMVDEETSAGVLQSLVGTTLPKLADLHADRVVDLTKGVLDRLGDGPGVCEARRLCLSLLADLYVWKDEPESRRVIFEMIKQPDRYSVELGHLAHRFRWCLSLGPTDPPDPKEDAVRQRSVSLVEELARSSTSALYRLEERHQNGSEPRIESDKDQAGAILKLIDAIGTEFYFASGGFNEEDRSPGERGGRTLSLEEKRRFLAELGPTLDCLSERAAPHTAHYLLMALETLMPADPSAVLQRIAITIRGALAFGYQYDGMAIRLGVRLVERYLSEYVAVLCESQDRRKEILAILDVFVQAGWPEALKLVYRLDDVFR